MGIRRRWRLVVDNGPGPVVVVEGGDAESSRAVARSYFERAWSHRIPVVRVWDPYKRNYYTRPGRARVRYDGRDERAAISRKLTARQARP